MRGYERRGRRVRGESAAVRLVAYVLLLAIVIACASGALWLAGMAVRSWQ